MKIPASEVPLKTQNVCRAFLCVPFKINHLIIKTNKGEISNSFYIFPGSPHQ